VEEEEEEEEEEKEEEEEAEEEEEEKDKQDKMENARKEKTELIKINKMHDAWSINEKKREKIDHQLKLILLPTNYYLHGKRPFLATGQMRIIDWHNYATRYI